MAGGHWACTLNKYWRLLKNENFNYGANGFLGSRVFQLLSKLNKVEIIRLDRQNDDLLSRLTVDKYQNKQIGMIIHMAGITSMNISRLGGGYEANVQMAKNIVKIAKGNPTKKIIFISSNAVNYRIDKFANSKKKAEKILKDGFDKVLILRPKLIIGKRSPEIEWLKKWLLKFRFIPYLIWPGWKFDPIEVDLLAKKIVMETESKQTGAKTIGGKKIGVRSFLQKLQKPVLV